MKATLTVPKIAIRLKVDKATVYRWWRNGTLPPPIPSPKKRNTVWDTKVIEDWVAADFVSNIDRLRVNLAIVLGAEKRLEDVKDSGVTGKLVQVAHNALGNLGIPIAVRKIIADRVSALPLANLREVPVRTRLVFVRAIDKARWLTRSHDHVTPAMHFEILQRCALYGVAGKKHTREFEEWVNRARLRAMAPPMDAERAAMVSLERNLQAELLKDLSADL